MSSNGAEAAIESKVGQLPPAVVKRMGDLQADINRRATERHRLIEGALLALGVDVDDPAVKVNVEQDGSYRITPVTSVPET